MSSRHERTFNSLEQRLRPKIEELRTLVQRKGQIVKEMAEIIEDSHIMDPEWISGFLKWLFQKEDLEVSDTTIERACGPLQKNRRKLRKIAGKMQDLLDEKELELSTDGNVYPEHRPEFDLEPGPIPTNEEILATSTDIAVNTIVDLEAKVRDLEIRLDEALDLSDKKQDEIAKLQLSLGEFELQLRDKMEQLKRLTQKENQLTDTVIAELQNENKRLKEALRVYVKKEEFGTANKVESPSTVWVQALNCFGFARSLMQISMKLSDHSARLKVLFDIAADGSIKNPRLEEQETHS